ncbi:ROK family transcriptional regulator [Paenibacillus nanensis]|uniref:ROK family transcriptional regulator n=1 Tax=Paenibacillus nanensis TaxID=393251 RepID=A0A3A1UT27_9BACL|nr:ROK family transcriptional regulator [Paenibacillus nanensis]RIX51414.1 ROK family transcriptional regulator [Paenibacillus nanensis]
MNERISTPKEMKKAVLRGIRSVLLASGSATKAELSEKLGISFPTISKVVAQMEEAGELLDAGLDLSSGGRRAQRYAYNPDYKLGAALFLEKSETQYTIYNALGEVKEQGTAPGFLFDDIEALAKHIEALLDRFPRIRSLSFGVPGAVDGGRIIFIPGYEKFQHFDLKGYFEQRFAIPVVAENDMNAAVLGYYDRVSAGESPSLIYLYFGQNGPGAGILIGGQVVRGMTSFSGEVSFVPLYDAHNFQQAIASAGGAASVMRESAGVDAVSRLIAAFTAILNPSAVIFCQDEVSGELLDAIAARSASYIAKEHLPRLMASDWKEDYLNGLKRLGLQVMISTDE